MPAVGEILFWLFAIASLGQAAFWFWLSRLFDTRQFQVAVDVGSNPKLPPASLIICARNETENLCKNLPFILAQQYPSDWELVVVNDASEDETARVLEHFQMQFPDRLRLVNLAQKHSSGKKVALSAGIAAAKFDSILLTDADCKPSGVHLLSKMMLTLGQHKTTEIVLGYGPICPSTWAFAPNWPRYEAAIVALQYGAFALAGMPYMGVGRNLAFRKKLYDRVGGFEAHKHLASGDDDLLVNVAANARNTVLCFAPEAFVYSAAPPDWNAWFKQKHRHLSTGTSYRWKHQMVLGALAFSHAAHYALLLLLLLIGFKPMLLLLIYVLRMALIVNALARGFGQLKEPGLLHKIPFYDLLMALFYGLFSPWALLQKKEATWGSRRQ